jgi:predicted nucleic acid-binding protein
MKQMVIADTSGLFSLASETDRNHQVAIVASEQWLQTEGAIILPADVFTETINILGKKAGHAFAIKTAAIILQEAAFVLVETEEEVRKDALTLFAKQREEVSFTDCVVMAVASRFATKQIFGFDEVFRKNGYRLPGAAEKEQAA